MEINEFWLKRHSEEYSWPPEENKTGTYRVALGELIDATQRKTYPPRPSYAEAPNPDCWNKSGSIGFMDLSVKSHLVPIEYARPLLSSAYATDDYEEKEALTIDIIGIEPEHQGKGHARFLKRRAEEIALEWNLDTIVSILIENSIMRDYNVRLGYALYDGGKKAVKRLNVKNS